MIEFRVDDMTCGSCANTITKAVKSVNANVEVQVEVKERTVRVEGAAQPERIEAAIREAGYTPVPSGESAAPSKPSKGCC